MESKNLSILGTKYFLILETQAQNKKLAECLGYVDHYAKEIHIEADIETDGKRPDLLQQKVIRHEVIHAFLQESGLAECSEWGRDETLVDWLALQIPKIIDVMKDAGGL